MNLTFWGTCGSLPAPTLAESVRHKIVNALKLAEGRTFNSEEEIEQFVDEELPFAVSGTYGGNTSCVQICAGGDDIYLLDAGSGLKEFSDQYMRRDEVNVPRHFHIFMTHLHWDHIQGFPFFAPAYIPGNKITFHGFHPDIETSIRKQMEPPCFPVPFDAMKAEINFVGHILEAPYEVGPFVIRSMDQNHPGNSFGYRFEADGKAVVYSTDSEHKEDAYNDNYRFIEFFKNADVVIFDAQYTLHDATFNKVDWGHSSNIMGVELTSRARAKHLILFHHDPANTDEDLDEYLVSTKTYADIYHSETDPRGKKPRYPQKISLAFDGLKVTI